MDIQITVEKKGWFKKKIVFKVSYENRTDYCYGLADLSLKLNKLEVNQTEIWMTLCKYENKYYKVK